MHTCVEWSRLVNCAHASLWTRPRGLATRETCRTSGEGARGAVGPGSSPGLWGLKNYILTGRLPVWVRSVQDGPLHRWSECSRETGTHRSQRRRERHSAGRTARRNRRDLAEARGQQRAAGRASPRMDSELRLEGRGQPWGMSVRSPETAWFRDRLRGPARPSPR